VEHEDAKKQYATELASGKVPGIRRIRGDLSVGQSRAQEIRDFLAKQLAEA
jgi:hypothetical protein